MPLIETLTIEVGSAVAKSIFKTWLKEYDLASDASASIVDVLKSWTTDNITRRRAQRQLEEIGEKVGESLLPIFEKEGDSLDDASRTAIALAVAETLNTTSSEVLAQHDLDASKLATYLLAHSVVGQHFNETEQSLYQRIISRSCQYIVAIASDLPTFTEHTFAEVLKRESQLLKIAEQTLRTVNDERGQMRLERERRLQAMLIDHRGFINARLESFVGREQELAAVHRRIDGLLPTGGYLLITGQAGQGKSSIIAKLVDEYGQENVAYHFIPFMPGPDHQVGLMRNLVARLILKYDLSDLYVTSESRPALRDYFPHVLSDVSRKGGREVIFLDGLDQLEEDTTGVRDLSFLPTNPPPGIVFVLGTRPNDALKPLELLKPLDEYQLPNLSRKDFDSILQHRHVALERVLADRFYHAMQENALYLDLVAQELAKSGESRPEEIIERVATNPDNLFSLSMRRLKRQKGEWREVVKPLLGLLLVAREPLSFPHIRQILHLDADQLRDGIERLGGLVSNDGTGRYALFHLKFYDYLRQDEINPQKDYLFARDEEETWHHTMANWCEQGNIELIWEDTPSNRIEQERRVYARKHFIAHLYSAKNWDRMFDILDAHSFGQKKIHYDPSMRSYSEDLDMGRKAAASEHWTFDEGVSMLPHLWRYTLLQCSLASRADRYPESAFCILMLLDREQEALGLAELLTDRAKKVRVLIRMATARVQQKKGEGSQKQEAIDFNLLMEAYEVSRTIEKSAGRDYSLSLLAAALAQAQEWTEAQRVIDTIEDGYSRACALSALGAALAQAQGWERAQAVWAEAQRVIDTIEEGYSRACALSELGAALAHAQEREQAQEVWAEAQRVIDTIEDSLSRPISLSMLAVALAHAQEWAEAQRVIDTIGDDSSSRVKALSELGAALAQAQEREQAQEVWAEAQRVIDTIDSLGRDDALSELAAALAQAQEWAEAQRVIDTIEYNGRRADALSELAAALVQAQEREQAQEVWAEAQRVIDTIEDSLSRPISLSMLAALLVQAQEWAEAQRVIDTIKQHVFIRAEALSKLAAALAQAQEWAEAQRVIDTIDTIGDDSSRVKALSKLATALAQAQKWAEAQRVIDTIRNDSSRVKALSELGAALAQAQEWEQAQAVWAKAQRVIDTIQYSLSRASTLSALGAALAQAQEREQAQAVWAKAQRVIDTIEDQFERKYALTALGVAFAQAQEWTEAQRVINIFEDNHDRVSILLELGAAFFNDNKFLQLLRLVQRSWQQADTLNFALRVLPLANYLMPLKPGIGIELLESFSWVENFLKG